MTIEDLIVDALVEIGALGQGQTARAEQLNAALRRLNRMIGQWNVKRMLLPHLVEVVKQANGSLSYSVGPGADFDIARPTHISDAFVRLNGSNPSQPVDYPITVLSAREDYNRISLKSMGAFPYYAFYDSGSPIGTIYFWPVPSRSYELHIFAQGVLQGFPSLTSTVVLPPVYEEAIFYNLAVRLAPSYGVRAKPETVVFAVTALNTLRQANTQIASLRLPGVLTRNTRSSSLPTFVGKPGI